MLALSLQKLLNGHQDFVIAVEKYLIKKFNAEKK